MPPLQQSSDHITIVMATRNGAAHLGAQLASIAGQSHRNWSLFVSDDRSEDATLFLLKDFARNHPVTIVEGPCQGAAQNFLSALCHPDLPAGAIALADQDDVWLRGKLARGLRRIKSAEAASRSSEGLPPVLYGAESFLADGSLRPLSITRTGHTKPSFAPSLAQNLFAGHTIMLNHTSRELIRSAGTPAELAYHDWWLYQLIAGAGGRLLLDPLPVVIYRQHGKNLIGAARGIAGAKQRLRKLVSGEWREAMQGHAKALESRASLLSDEALALLQSFRAAPRKGAARVKTLRELGVRRSSGLGNLCMETAAILGRV